MTKFPNIPNKDITYFGYRAEPYFASEFICGGLSSKVNSKKYLKLKNTVKLFQVNFDFFNYQPSVEKFSKELLHNIKTKDKSYIQNIVKNCFFKGKSLIKTSRQIYKQSAGKNLSNEKLISLLEKYSKIAYEYCIFYTVAWFEKPERNLAQILAKKYSKNQTGFEKLYSIICTPSRETAAEHEQDAFLRLAQNKIKFNKLQLNKLAELHAQKFGWLSVRYFIGEPWKAGDILKRLKAIDHNKAQNLLQNRLLQRKTINQALQKAMGKMNAKDKGLIDQIREVIFLRTQRSDFFHHSSFYMQPFLRKAAEKLKVNYLDLLNFSHIEILNALKGTFDVNPHIIPRRECFLGFYDETGLVLEGKTAKEYIAKRPSLQRKFEPQTSVTGNTANPGIITGKAKIVMSNKDLVKVKKGDILITTMTTPNYISAMELASAFVTDEGGILCHAAIISREMKKPCVIGTKIATKILKDGMMVEVNANTGIIKIIK